MRRNYKPELFTLSKLLLCTAGGNLKLNKHYHKCQSNAIGVAWGQSRRGAVAPGAKFQANKEKNK